MAPHSSTLAWKIPGMEEPGGLQSMELLQVRHSGVTSLSLFTFMHWRRKWPPTPVFLPGESQRRGSLMGCYLWGLTESDTTEVTQHQQQTLSFFLHFFPSFHSPPPSISLFSLPPFLFSFSSSLFPSLHPSLPTLLPSQTIVHVLKC